MLSMQICAGPNCPESVMAAGLLMEDARNRPQGNNYDFFGNFFMAQGMERLGGNYARQTQNFHANYFVPWQAKDGSWTGSGFEAGPGRAYTTSMAILALTAREQRLPVSKP